MVKRSLRGPWLVSAVLMAICQFGQAAADEALSVPTGTAGKPPAAETQSNGDAASQLSTAGTTTAVEKRPEPLDPLFVRPLAAIGAGRNDSLPQWSPSAMLLTFERSIGEKREIRILYPDGTPVDTVYYLLSAGSSGSTFFFPGVYEEVSYNTGLTWSPGGDRFVFMSNGGEGNYDLYLQELGRTAVRLTDHKEKDGQAQWSPAADRIAFVSGRSGNGDVYLMDLSTRVLSRVTRGGKSHLYPRWSPDGKKLAMMHGSNENHHIVLITDIARPAESRKMLTSWQHDDLRPVWSPDGSKIAFYSNYNALNDPKLWSIVVIASDGSDPAEGEGLAARVVAADVIPDIDAGPAWMPDSSRIVFVKNDRQEYNPLYVADIRQGTSAPIRTETKMNHDVSCSSDGTIAFRAQVNQWDQIFIMRLKP